MFTAGSAPVKSAGREEAALFGDPTQGPPDPPADPADVPDGTLVDRIRRGDRGAAEALVRRHHGRIHRLVHHLCDGDPDAAEELTQEVFERILANLPAFRGEAAFSTWAHRIAVNRCLDHRRRKRRWRWLFPAPPGRGRREAEPGEAFREDPMEADVDPAEAAGPMKNLWGKEFSRRARQALTALPDRQRVVFYLKVFEEMKLSEIADTLGLGEGTVKSHLFRATRTLREELKEWNES